MAIEIAWINHASFRLAGSKVVYIDPWKLPSSRKDGNVVFISHAHFDHCSPADAEKALAPDGVILGPADVVAQIGRKARTLRPGATVEVNGVKLTGVPAYNIGKAFHPKANQWLGAVIELDTVRLYYAGDTDALPEMGELGSIDVALLPVGGTYTMDACQAAKAAKDIGCKAAIPYHFGDIIGSTGDAKRFASEAPCKVHVLAPGAAVIV